MHTMVVQVEAEVQEDEKGNEEWQGMVEEKTGSADTAAVIDLTQSDHSDDEEEETGGSKRPAVDVKVGREQFISKAIKLPICIDPDNFEATQVVQADDFLNCFWRRWFLLILEMLYCPKQD